MSEGEFDTLPVANAPGSESEYAFCHLHGHRLRREASCMPSSIHCSLQFAFPDCGNLARRRFVPCKFDWLFL